MGIDVLSRHRTGIGSGSSNDRAAASRSHCSTTKPTRVAAACSICSAVAGNPPIRRLRSDQPVRPITPTAAAMTKLKTEARDSTVPSGNIISFNNHAEVVVNTSPPATAAKSGHRERCASEIMFVSLRSMTDDRQSGISGSRYVVDTRRHERIRWSVQAGTVALWIYRCSDA